MGREWQIGDPVDYTTDGWMDAQNWGHDSDDEDDNVSGKDKDSRASKYSNRAWSLYMDFRDEDALRYINRALNLDDRNARDWNRKGIILESLERYDESERCYDRSLELSKSYIVYDNKARMLYDWAARLLEDSKEVANGLEMLDEAYSIVLRAINALPGENSEEDVEKYLRLRDSVNFYIGYERKFRENLEILKSYDKDELFTITGMKHYGNGVGLTPGLALRLSGEPDNEFDMDAIAVYADDKKIGYVANSARTKCGLTSSATELKGRFQGEAAGEYLLYLERYAKIQFAVGRLLK